MGPEQLSFADVDAAAERRCATPPSWSSTWRPPAAGPPRAGPAVRRDHRNRGGQGPRRSGAGRVRHAGRPRPRHPAADRAADRHHLGDGMRRADHRRRAADVLRVRPRRGPGRPQRRLRHRFSAGRRATLRHRLAAAAGAVHRSTGPPGAQPRGSAQRAARRAGEAVRGGQRSPPTGHSTTRGPPSTYCTR